MKPGEMTINANTKIGAVLKKHPEALDAIISLSSKFEKLRNPFLRKIMAGRTSLAMASKLGDCSLQDFFNKLEGLGFTIDRSEIAEEEKQTRPAFMDSIEPGQIVDMDVRPVIASGQDPLQQIMQKVKTILPGQAMRIINSFEPTPLMILLEKKGFICYADHKEEKLVETYFYKPVSGIVEAENIPINTDNLDWDAILQKYGQKTKTIDVRGLEMPQPMITILGELESLEKGKALYVIHKRIPVYLLPELAERQFDHRIKEISENEVHLLIFRR